MIFTQISIKNWYSFKDCTLDLSYPKKVTQSSIPFEYLEDFENIRFKRAIILSGANATGKTSFAKIFLAIRNFIAKNEISSFFSEGLSTQAHENLAFQVEFIDRSPQLNQQEFCADTTESKKIYNHYHSLYVELHPSSTTSKKLDWKICYKCIEIRKSDSIQSLRKILDDINETYMPRQRGALYLNNLHYDLNSIEARNIRHEFEELRFTNLWHFLYNDGSETEANVNHNLNRETLELILKTFDPSIENVKNALEQGNDDENNGFFVNFKNGKKIYISQHGKVNEDRHLLSLGTYDAIKIANFVSILLATKNKRGCTFFLDESMAHVQSEIERTIVNLIIQKMNKYSQFFYTTHNYDVLDMNLPIHSYLFIGRDENYHSYFIKAEETFKKNDRSIINYIKNDVLQTLPNTSLLDHLLMQDE